VHTLRSFPLILTFFTWFYAIFWWLLLLWCVGWYFYYNTQKVLQFSTNSFFSFFSCDFYFLFWPAKQKIKIL
jgi:hypothetical protein